MLFLCNLDNFPCDVFLTGAPHVDILALRAAEVAGDCFPESLSSVPTRSMDEQRMEENSIALFHHHVDPGAVRVILLDAMVHFVNSSLPLGVIMWLQRAFVGAWEHNQTTVVSVNVLHGCPSTNNSVTGSEGEIVQILVQGMPGSLLARIWRLVDQHRMYSHNIGSRETLHIFQNLGEAAVSEQLLVFLEVLDLCNHPLTWYAVLLHNGHIFHYNDPRWFHLLSADSFKLCSKTLNVIIRYQIFNDEKPIFFIKFSLLQAEDIIIQSIPELFRAETGRGGRP